MKVILLKSVPKVGKSEEIVEVSEGFARNALFPRRLAVPATEQAIDTLRKKQSGKAAEKAVQQTLLEKAIEEAEGKSLVYFAAANEQGGLFSKLDVEQVSEYLLQTHRLSIDPSCITIKEGVIKKVGSYTIAVDDGQYHAHLTIEIKRK